MTNQKISVSEKVASTDRVVLVSEVSGLHEFLDFFREIEGLAISAGAYIADHVGFSKRNPDAASFIGSGKIQEIKEAINKSQANLVVIDDSISPIQERNLEKALECRVIDRTRLILDIFSLRAKSHEGKLQVELAQLRHLSSRLVRGWTHLERQRGGIGLRGPGETQLETDRRLIGKRIRKLQEKLDKVSSQRNLRRSRRKRERIPTIAIVGYTNAGKSELFNRLTNENTYCADQLFATLDTTMRSIFIPGYGSALISDTVGFIRELPHTLIQAFLSTLEEVSNASLLLQVGDDSDTNIYEQEAQVENVLEDIGASMVPRLIVRNKADLNNKKTGIHVRQSTGQCIARISAKNGNGVDQLLHTIGEMLTDTHETYLLSIPASFGRLRSKVYSMTEVDSEILDADGSFVLTIRTDNATIGQIKKEPDFEPSFLSTLDDRVSYLPNRREVGINTNMPQDMIRSKLGS